MHSTANFIFYLFGKLRLKMLVLPRKGFKSITITDKLHEQIKKRAKEANITLREYIEYLFAKDTVAKKET